MTGSWLYWGVLSGLNGSMDLKLAESSKTAKTECAALLEVLA